MIILGDNVGDEAVKPWYEGLNLGWLSDADRVKILQYVVDKHGRERVREVLKVSRITMWRLLNGKSRLDDERLKLLLSLITEDEFRRVLEARKVLEAAGLFSRVSGIYVKAYKHPRVLVAGSL
ncbi:MAG: hypothetical protein QXZ56_04640 [Sulfolobales archaeon]